MMNLHYNFKTRTETIEFLCDAMGMTIDENRTKGAGTTVFRNAETKDYAVELGGNAFELNKWEDNSTIIIRYRKHDDIVAELKKLRLLPEVGLQADFAIHAWNSMIYGNNAMTGWTPSDWFNQFERKLDEIDRLTRK